MPKKYYIRPKTRAGDEFERSKSMFNSDVIKGWVVSLIRLLAGSALTYAIAKGYLTEESAGQLVVIVAGAIVVAVSALIGRIRSDVKVQTALDLPAGSTKGRLDAVLSNK